MGESVLARESSGVRTHSQAILPMIQELLAQAGITLRQCDAIAFGAGPGSFTGVRTACGIAQGLAFGAALPVLPLVTLAAMALACHRETGATEILTVLDARMGEVYWAQYHYANGLQVLAEAALCAPGALPTAPSVSPMGRDLPAAWMGGCALWPEPNLAEWTMLCHHAGAILERRLRAAKPALTRVGSVAATFHTSP